MKKNFFWMTMKIYHMSFKLYPSWCFIDSTHPSEPFIIKKGRNVFIPRQMKMFFDTSYPLYISVYISLQGKSHKTKRKIASKRHFIEIKDWKFEEACNYYPNLG